MITRAIASLFFSIIKRPASAWAVSQSSNSSGLSGHNVANWTDGCLRFAFSALDQYLPSPHPLRRALVIIGPGIGCRGQWLFLGARLRPQSAEKRKTDAHES
jgi:hypothetical protein